MLLQTFIKKTHEWFLDEFYRKKLYSISGFTFLLIASIIVAWVNSYSNSIIGYIIAGGLIGVACMLLVFIDSFFAITMAVLISIFMNPLHKYLLQTLPLGVLIDIVIITNFIGCISKNLKERRVDFRVLRHPVTLVQLIVLIFTGLQIFNPEMHSYIGYFSMARRIPVYLAVYFIGIYNSSNILFYKKIISFWFIIALINAIYAIFQEVYGLSSFEMRYFNSNELAFGLTFIEGRWRKFGFFNDPTAFGIFMAVSGLFFIILSIGSQLKTKYKIGVILSCIMMFMAMAFSGTRTAYAMLTCGVVFYSLMTINEKRTLIFASLFFLLLGGIIFGPFYGNKTINRIRSTFESKDASLNVRDVNRAYIQPYIHTHPFGGGVATSGVAGKKYNPHHPLAGFPPDSGYLASALETGWIGLILLLSAMFIYIHTCIKGYYRTHGTDTKTFYLGFASVMMMLIIGQYAQSAFGVTLRIILGLMFAFSVKIKDISPTT